MTLTSSTFIAAAATALCLMATSATAGVCPAEMPVVQASIPQMFKGDSSDYDWTISLTTPVDKPMKGTGCSETAYIAQYTTDGFCDASMTDLDGATPTSDGCTWSYSDALRQMIVQVSCDSGASGLQMGSPVNVVSTSSNKYIYTFTAKYAGVCSGDADGGSGGSSGPCGAGCAFVIIVLVGGAVYVIGMVAFNAFKGKRGKELAPHPEFWLMIPGLLKDGVMFSFNTITSTCRKDSGSGSTYTQV